MILDLTAWHPTTPETEAKWRRLGVRPLLTVDVDGLGHTISLDFGVRDGRVAAFDSDTGNRVYVIGHEGLSDPLDVALATPVYRPPYRQYPWSTPEVTDPDDDEIHEPPTFGTRYRATAEQIEEDIDGEALHLADDGEWYDLQSGYGPTWVRDAVPPIEAIAGVVARMVHDGACHYGHVTITDYGDYSVIMAGWIEVKAPPFRLGSSGERIPHLVSRLTRDVFERTFFADEGESIAYAISFNSAGFWHWFARVALSAGLRALQVSEREGDTLYLMLDKQSCSGDDGPTYGPSTEPQVP